MSIIKSHLPPQHINVLRFLLEFLNEISAKSDMNKMTVQNLSIVFGPTILIPSKQLDDIGGALRQIKISQNVMSILQVHGLNLEDVYADSESQEEMLERLKGIMGDDDAMNTRFSTMLNRGGRGKR